MAQTKYEASTFHITPCTFNANVLRALQNLDSEHIQLDDTAHINQSHSENTLDSAKQTEYSFDKYSERSKKANEQHEQIRK